MKRFYVLFSLFALIAGTMSAQRIVSVGEQVTDASQLNSTDHYVIKLVSYYTSGTKTDVTEAKYFYTTGGRMKLGTLDPTNATDNNNTNTFLVNLHPNSTSTADVWAVGLGTYYLSSFTSGSGAFNQSSPKQDFGYKFESIGDDNAFVMHGYRGATAGLYLAYNNSSDQVEVTSGTTNAMIVKIYKVNTNINEGKFYNLTMRGTGTSNYVVFNNGLFTKTNSSKSTATDGVWFFKKDLNAPSHWFMYNAEVGDEYGVTATTANNSRTMFTKNPTSFTAINGNKDYFNNKGFALNISGYATLNDVSGAIGVWNAEGALKDAGSTFVPTEVTDAYALCTFTYTDATNSGIQVVRHSYQKVGEAPTIPTIGYFTATTSSFDKTVSATASENTFTVEGTFSYPFAISTSSASTWYSMLVRPSESNHDVVANGSAINTRVSYSNVATTYDRFNDGLFSFVQSGNSENFKLKTRSGKYLQFIYTTGNGNSYNSRNLTTTTDESAASDFKITKSTRTGAADTDFLILPVFSHSDATYVVGDHNGGALSVWSTNTSNNGAYGDDGSRFQIKNADTASDILAIGATAKANTMATATPSTYVGGISDAAIASFKAQTFTSLSNLEEQAIAFQSNNDNLQKPKTDKLYTLRFTRYGADVPVYAAFKNAVADADGTVKGGDGNTPSERLIGFSTTAGATAVVRFIQNGEGYNIQDVNSNYYYGTYGEISNIYAVKNVDHAGIFTVENSIDGNLTIVGLKDTKSTDITHQYLFCCGDDQTDATTNRDYLQFHSPYTNNATTGTTSTIEPGCKMQIQELATFPVTISEAQYASLCLPFSVTLPDGVTANKVTAIGDSNELNLEEIGTTIAANEPVILSGSAATYNLTVNASDNGTQTSGNLLTGAIVKRTGISDTYYALGYKAIGDAETKTAGFFKVGTTNMPANKAYLLKTSIPVEQQSVAMFSFNFGGVTGINQATKTTDAESNVYYDLQGHRVLYPAHGIFVKANGQKVFIK